MKRIALVFVLLCLLACSKEETKPIVREDRVDNKVLGNLAMETKDLAGLTDGSEQVKFEALPLNDFRENFSQKEISQDPVLGFDPEKEVLYQDISQPNIEAYKMLRSTNFKTGMKMDIDLGKTYKYIDASKVVDGCLYFIGSNTDDSVDYVEIHPEGQVKRVELSSFARIAASYTQEGFYINLEKNLSQDEMENSLLYIEFGGDKAQELFKESFKVGDNGLVKEGHFFSNFYGMGSVAGFQELEDFSENAVEVKGSYLFDRDTKTLYRIPFIDRFSAYLAGSQDLIVSLKAHKPQGDIEKDRCMVYKKEGEGYKAYILPGYEYSNFIRQARLLKEECLFIYGDTSLDFLDLETMEGKRISLEQEGLGPVYFHKDKYLSFVKKGGDKDVLYWGSIDLK